MTTPQSTQRPQEIPTLVTAERIKGFSNSELEAIKKIIENHSDIEDGVERCMKLSKRIRSVIKKETILFRLVNQGEELGSYWSYGITNVKKSVTITRKATVDGKNYVGVYLVLCY